jgi:hypothetical protein
VLIILPDPTTRPCRVHPDELMTDSRPCMLCWWRERLDELFADFAERLREAHAA